MTPPPSARDWRLARLDLGLLTLLVLLSALSMIAGKVWVPLNHLGAADDPRWLIITELRVPRTLLAIAVGGALGLGGATLQGYTRNPLPIRACWASRPWRRWARF
jgi:iron complex transport system permease protein